MKAAIYNPYLDTLGGGERYSMSVARVLADAGYKVEVEWSDASIKKKLEDRFEINLEGVSFVDSVNRGDLYDVCFWVSDGSIPTLKARKNILHFQVPFHDVYSNNLFNKIKMFRIKKIVCNSNFTKGFIDKEYGVKSEVVYPPVDIEKFKSKRKENLIVYIGRFSKLVQAKGQDVLIRAFKTLYDKEGVKDWKLVLAGGTEVGAGEYFEELKKTTTGYPISIVESPSFKKIKELYGKAKIFWSASGHGVDESKNPQRVEHFGITVVEAMAAGAVPIVYNAGGHKEIVTNGKDGFLWERSQDLIETTKKIIQDQKILRKLAQEAKKTSEKFSFKVFEKKFLKLI